MITPTAIDVTLIVSVFNEELNLPPLVERTVTVMERYPHCNGWEMILIDDASTDNGWQVMKELQLRFPQYIRLDRHSQRLGQKGCFMSGFNLARGWLSILMDADLQVLPEELPLVLDKAIQGGYEMVCTHNDLKRGGKRRSWVSWLGNIFMKILFQSPVRDAGGNFMAIQTRYVRGVNLIANDQRYLLPISMRRGLTKISEVGCVFALRAYGRSKYSKLKKSFQGIPEMFQLKQRLLSGFYDLPPVLPEERVSRATRQIVQPAFPSWLEPQLVRANGAKGHRQAIQTALTPDMRAWSLVEDEQLRALASLRSLPWDTEVLQQPSGLICGIWSDGNYLTQREYLKKVLGACVKDAEDQNIGLLSLRLAEQEIAALNAAESIGFRIIESYLTFTHDLSGVPVLDSRVRLAAPEDQEAASELAYQAFRYNRFLSDPLIPQERARHSRREWVRNAFKGRAEAIYVAEVETKLAGFILLKSNPTADGQRVGVIDLIAVNPECARQGIGTALVIQALHHYQGKAKTVEVGTQGKNIPSVNLYIRCGFRLLQSELSLHRHSLHTRIQER